MQVLAEWSAHNSPLAYIGTCDTPAPATLCTVSTYGSIRIWNVPCSDIVTAFNKHREASKGGAKVKKRDIKVRTITWNVNEWRPIRNALNVRNFITGDDPEDTPDVLVLGIQEAVALNAGQVFNTDYTVLEDWEDYTQSVLNTIGRYVLVESDQLVGVALLVYIKASLVHGLQRPMATLVKCGFSGMAGNKGAVAVRFELFEESFCFVNTHLAAGQKDVKARNENYNTILKTLVFGSAEHGQNIMDHTRVWWIGDLNYRLDMKNEEVRQS